MAPETSLFLLTSHFSMTKKGEDFGGKMWVKAPEHDSKRNKSLPHHMVIGTRALLALKWLVWR